MTHPTDDELEAMAVRQENADALDRDALLNLTDSTAAMLRACKTGDAPDQGEKQAYIEGTQAGWDAALEAAKNACMKLRHSHDLENDDQRVGVLECLLAIVKLKKGSPK